MLILINTNRNLIVFWAVILRQQWIKCSMLAHYLPFCYFIIYLLFTYSFIFAPDMDMIAEATETIWTLPNKKYAGKGKKGRMTELGQNLGL